ncbi:MAG: metal ABC transporter permease, partial [Arenicellales bacterium]|nr:metal ABC transporter permease [Arenicellales bacterium]
ATEKEIQNNFSKLSEGKTTLVIAHRLSTIVDSDEILVLDDGQITERGTHVRLLEQRGLYSRLWAEQKKEEQENNTTLEESMLSQK